MSDQLWLEDARTWLTKEAHQQRRVDLFVAIGMLATSAGSIGLGLWLLGLEFTAAGLAAMGVLYLVYGRLKPEAPVISAETSRRRTLGVIRNPWMTRNAYEQAWVEWNFAIGFLMAPVHLIVEAVRLLLRRRNLRVLESDTAAGVIAMLAERRAAVALSELSVQFAYTESVLAALGRTRGVVMLRDPDRVSLTDPVIDEIRAG